MPPQLGPALARRSDIFLQLCSSGIIISTVKMGGDMARRQCGSIVLVVVLAIILGVELASSQSPEGTLTVAVATFGNERWLPHLYPGAEDVVLKPMMENLLSRDLKTGDLSPMLAERWEVLEGARAWRFYLRKGGQFHDGHGEMTVEDIKFTIASIAKEGSANGLAPEFRLIKSMEIDDPYTILKVARKWC